MDISLHLGAHRTGTTALQAKMSACRDQLWDAGIAYWGPERTRAGLLAGLVKNPNTLTQADSLLGKRSCGRLRMEFERMHFEGCSQVFISEENILGTMGQNTLFCRPYPHAAARLERFAPAFEGHSLRISLAIRSYEAHWASQLAYRIAVGGGVPTKANLDRMATQPRRWRTVLNDIARVFPDAEIVVWAFEGYICNQAPLLPAILGRDLQVQTSRLSPKYNASLSSKDLMALAIERGDKDGAARLAKHHGRYKPFNVSQTIKLQSDYHNDLTWLEAGADGLVTYLNPTEGTFGGHDMTKGSHHDRQETSVASAR